ncbi:hypothetical protein ACWEO4_14720 [Streptomyces sp. NPDC004393]|uniref:hypothetical protein n=1 Tax=Streptomyces sp. NPDC004533 TaxID=3154278 RepID=UPI0033A56FC8
MATRSTVVTAALAAGAALVATGITYANAASEPAQAAPAVAAPAPAAAPAAPAAGAPAYTDGNSGNGNNNGNNNNYGNNNDNSKGHEGGEEENEEEQEHHKGEGKIFVNEREYSPHEASCITVVSGLGANSLNVRNDSKKTVEVFRGATCDNGAPIATVGPHSSSNGLFPGRVRGGVKVKHGVVGSIRIVHRNKGFDD